MKKLFWAVFILSLLATIPMIVERIQTELENNKYEIVLPNHELRTLIANGADKGTVYSVIKEAGVHSVSVTPLTLKELEDRNIVQVMEKEDLLLNGESEEDALPKKQGVYIKILDRSFPSIEDILESAYDEKIWKVVSLDEIEEHPVYFVEGPNQKIVETDFQEFQLNPIYKTALGFDENEIKNLIDQGFGVVFRIENMRLGNQQFIVDQMISLSNKFNQKKLLFNGKETLGFPEKTKDWAEYLQNHGFDIVSIEFNNQKGLETYGYTFNPHVIRLHSIDLTKGKSKTEYVERAKRAIKERNIRMLYFHIADKEKLFSMEQTPEQVMNDTLPIIQEIQQTMPERFHAGTAEPFTKMNSYKWGTVAALIGLAGFSALLLFEFPLLAYTAAIVLTVLAGGYAVLELGVILKVAALGAAILSATAAALSALHMKDGSRVTIVYLRAALIALTGVWFVVVLLFGNDYLVKVNEFKGVKLLYLGPIILTATYLLKDNWKKIAVAEVKYYQLLLGLILGAAGFYFLIRSGNEASVSMIELKLRQWLETILYVRPRTKEFLIGFPLMMLAIYLISQGKRYGRFLLVGGVIGYLSMVNTFTHLHIPLHLSMLRTLYGLVIGYLLGIGLIVLYRVFITKIWPFIAARW